MEHCCDVCGENGYFEEDHGRPSRGAFLLSQMSAISAALAFEASFVKVVRYRLAALRAPAFFNLFGACFRAMLAAESYPASQVERDFRA